MDNKTIASTISGFLGVFFSTQITQEALNITLTILSIISILCSFVLTFIKWWKEAKKDGKIDIDEAEDIASKAKEAADKAKEEIEDGDKRE